MSDIIQKIGHSIIQHGKENNRIYLMKYNEVNALSLLEQIEKLGRDNNYNKIVAKVPLFAKNDFEDYGYKKEAYIPNYFNRKDDCFFMCKYLHDGSPKIIQMRLQIFFLILRIKPVMIIGKCLSCQKI